jgi:hypothetical protein
MYGIRALSFFLLLQLLQDGSVYVYPGKRSGALAICRKKNNSPAITNNKNDL